jgi:hypothetical protein
LRRKRFSNDLASAALDVWDSVVGYSDSMDRQMAVFQPLAGLGCPAVMTTPRLRVPYPSYAIANRAITTKLAV